MASIKRIGKYDILEMIGRGGMGVVFKATDPMLGRLVAIKMMTGGFADDPDLLKRFYREAQSTASLTHPNIVTVYYMGDQDGMPYLVMQFLEGESLHAIIKSRHELSLLTKTNYLLQACHGLKYAHERRITHRDIKPANIMVLPDGTVKIVDFGIARIGNDRLTHPGQLMGSIHYMSPEQINEGEVDARSDIFALGTVAYEFLTYTLPFQGQDVPSTLLKILYEPAPPLSVYLENYPPEFDAILGRALAKKKAERYQTVDELAFDLAQVENQLRKEMIAKLHLESERLISGGDLAHAREQLQQLIKLDPQNPSANRHLLEVQQEIQEQRRSEEVRQLRVQAEQLTGQQDFDTALRLLEQAIALAPEQVELKALRDSVNVQKARYDLIRKNMDEARVAREAGDLEGALRSLGGALAVQPDNRNACRLKDEVALEIAERDKQRQLKLLIAEARRQISSRKFSDALETLEQVEELDGKAPRLRELMQLAAEGAEQELRRRALEKATAETTEALERPDPSLARDLAEAALERFPGERGLLKLKKLAEQQIEARGRHLWLVEQMTTARTLQESGKSEDALAVLEAAWQKYPGEGDLESLMSMVRAAIFAKEEADHAEFEKKVDGAVAEAQQLIDSGDYERAVQFLESALRDLPDDDLRIFAASARRQLAAYRHGLDELIATANQLSAQERPADAVACLEAQRATYNRESRFKAAWEEASQQHRQDAIGKANAAIRTELAAGEFDAAEREISAARRDLGDIGELRQLEEALQALRQNEMETALSRTENLVLRGADTEALATLQSVVDLIDRVPLELRMRHENLKSAIYQRPEEAAGQSIPTFPGTTAAVRETRLSPAVLRAQQLRENSVLELTPSEGIVRKDMAPPEMSTSYQASSSSGVGSGIDTVSSLHVNAESGTPITPGTNARTESASSEDAPGWPDDILRAVEKQLATFSGYLARILIKKAASRTNNLEELYAILAASLTCEADRGAFLARKAELRNSWTRSQVSREPLQVASSAASPNAASKDELTTAAIDRAAHILARHIGPIAGVLAKRSARRADNLRALYLLLAENIGDETERSRFLRDAGVK
jgi:eukaryotic-like serine/threonine-protein kinase